MSYYLEVLKNYANFSGRARRSEFWYFYLFNFIVSIVINFVAGLTGLLFLGYLYYLAMLIPSFAVGIRRMHDVDKSGWYYIIPIYNLVLCCTEGDRGMNRFGSDPKENAYSV